MGRSMVRMGWVKSWIDLASFLNPTSEPFPLSHVLLQAKRNGRAHLTRNVLITPRVPLFADNEKFLNDVFPAWHAHFLRPASMKRGGREVFQFNAEYE